MDEVYVVALEIYARAIADRMHPRPGEPENLSDAGDIARKAIDAAVKFIAAAHATSIEHEHRNLPTVGD
jgi:hypothetical protein